MTIEFGEWRLVPCDTRNWELCHRHATSRGKNEGEVRWHRLGRYYQHNTLDEALRYAASQELMQRNRDEAESIWEALREYERITQTLLNGVRNLPDAYSGPKAGRHD